MFQFHFMLLWVKTATDGECGNNERQKKKKKTKNAARQQHSRGFKSWIFRVWLRQKDNRQPATWVSQVSALRLEWSRPLSETGSSRGGAVALKKGKKTAEMLFVKDDKKKTTDNWKKVEKFKLGVNPKTSKVLDVDLNKTRNANDLPEHSYI